MIINVIRILFLFLLICTQTVCAADDSAIASDPVQSSTKILGGTEAKSGAWPWIAALLIRSNPDMYQAQYCAGSLIDDTWVLTAAHCVYGKTASEIDVAVGVFDLRNFSGDRIAVKSIRIHPRYNTEKMQNDIALLELSSPSAQPTVPLFSGRSMDGTPPSLLGRVLTAIGWGMADDTTYWYYPEKLRQVDLPVVADGKCNDIYPYDLISSQLCAGYDEGKDACNGDSGGPVVTPIDGAWAHAGLVSYGTRCDEYLGWYGVYTRTSEFIDFVKQYVPDVITTDPSENHSLSWLLLLLGH